MTSFTFTLASELARAPTPTVARLLAPYAPLAAPVTSLLVAAPLTIPILAVVGTVAAARALAPAPPTDTAVRGPLISAADWAAYRARGVWLPLSWLLAAAFLVGSHAAGPLAWGALERLVGADPMVLFVAAVVLPNAGLTLTGNLFFWFLYYFRFPSVEARRIDTARRPWPWAPDAKPAARAAFWALLPRSIARVVMNHAGLVPALALQHVLFGYLGMFDTSRETLPSLPAFLAQLAVCVVVEDVVFYHVHRILHVPWIYPHVHKIHHEWSHPIALASEHAHHLEFVFGNGMPVILGPMLTRCHSYVFSVWILIRIATSLDNHCGYNFALSPVRLLPWGTTAPGHDHHHTTNDGMLASQFTILDVLYRSLGSFPDAKRRTLARAGGAPPEAAEAAEANVARARDSAAAAAAAAEPPAQRGRSRVRRA